MFKNLKYASFILLVGCAATNNQEKIYTDLIPTIVGEEESDVSFIQDENLFVCNIDDKKGPQSFCNKDGKLFTGRVEMNFDDEEDNDTSASEDETEVASETENEDDTESESENETETSSDDDSLKTFYVFENGNVVKEENYENDKLISSSDVKLDNFFLAFPRIYSTTFYNDNGTIKAIYEYDDGNRSSVLTVYCPDGSMEKKVTVMQDTTTERINLTKITHFFKTNTEYRMSKFESFVYPAQYLSGNYTGIAEIKDCNGNTVETVRLENGRKSEF